MGLNIVVEVPTVVFVDDEVGRDKFAVNILGSTIGTSHALLGNDDGSNESGVGVMTFEIVGVIEPHDRTGVVGPWAGTLRHFPDVGVGRARGDDSVVRGIVRAIVVIRSF